MANSTSQRLLPWLLSICCGLLLWAAWPTSPLTFLIFVAFVPLLYLTERVDNRWRYFGCVFLAMLVWNVGTTWWVGNTPVPVSGVLANLFNALMMSIPWLGYKNTRKQLGAAAGYASLVVYWLTFEYIHLNWELSWPWLNLGNAFAMHPWWIQWYEYTGASGGTLWVLLSNIAIYNLWQKREQQPVPLSAFIWKNGWKPAAVIIIPLLLGAWIQYRLKATDTKPLSVLVVQPNIDPYDKFTNGAETQQMEKFLSLTQQHIDNNTDYIVWPETALFPRGAVESALNEEGAVHAVRNLLRRYPKAVLITGATTLKIYSDRKEAPYSARSMESGGYFDAFNSALLIDTSSSVQVYHKYKLVPGVEIIPYSRFLPFMESWAMDMGGITGSYGRTPGVDVLENTTQHIKAFSTICYESIYGEYIAQHVRLGAQLLFIITNDGWWGNTEGHRQHLQYARLRAIETRRWISRSANTGVSCFIDPAGDLQQPQPYWQEAVIKSNVTPDQALTFYVRYGDLISKGALIFCILLIVYMIVLRFTHKQAHVERN